MDVRRQSKLPMTPTNNTSAKIQLIPENGNVSTMMSMESTDMHAMIETMERRRSTNPRNVKVDL